jgi:hypothetical protein
MPLLTEQTVSLDGIEWGEVQPCKAPPPPDLSKMSTKDMSLVQLSQYIAQIEAEERGHWNKYGVIITLLGGASEVDQRYLRLFKGHFDDSPTERRAPSLDLPVSVRGERVVYTQKEVYWPVFNSTFNLWRARHKRGQDCVIFTQPKLYKLRKAIEWKMDDLYGEWEGINENNL